MRRAAAGLRSLSKEHAAGNDVVFLVVEQKEPHAGTMAFADIAQPQTFEERRALALRIRDELEVPLPILIDGMDDASRALFSDLPSPAFVIDRDGTIADKLPWADPGPLRASLGAVLGRRQVPAAVDPARSLEERTVFARRLLAEGEPARALQWLDVANARAAEVPPAAAAVALARITRAAVLQALSSSAPGARAEAVADARQAARGAWAHDPARLVAALTELAPLAADAETARSLWQEAAAALAPRAPDRVRAFLARMQDAAK